MENGLLSNPLIKAFMKGILSEKYAIIVAINKKGYYIMDFFRHEATEAIICSDRFLGSPECVRFLKSRIVDGPISICVFDDSVRYGHKLRETCEKIRDICQENGLVVPVNVKVLFAFSDFDSKAFIKDMKDENFSVSFDPNEDCFEVCPELKDMKERAKGVLKSLNESRSILAVGAPKANCDSMDTGALLSRMRMEKVDKINLLQALGIDFYERHFDERELCSMFNDKLGRFISHASVELYVYDETSVSMVARASLSRMRLDDIDEAVDGLWVAFRDELNSVHYRDIAYAPPVLKYEWLNYILSSLVFFTAFGDVSRSFVFETEHLAEHYGEAAAKIIKAAVEKMKGDPEDVKKRIISIFDVLEVDIAVQSLIDEPSRNMLEYFFGDAADKKNIINYYDIQSCLEVVTNDKAYRSKHKDEAHECVEVPVHCIINYFGECSSKTDVRKSFIRSQADGRVSVGPKLVYDSRNEPYVEKFPKVGEANIPHSQVIEKLLILIKDDDYFIFLAPFLVKWSLIEDNDRSEYLTSQVVERLQNESDNYMGYNGKLIYLTDNGHIHSNINDEEDDAVVKQEMLVKLKGVWSHMDEWQKDMLDELSYSSVKCLYTLFYGKGEYILRDGDFDLEEAKSDLAGGKPVTTEDIVVTLDEEGGALLVRVCSVVKEKEDGTIEKKLQRILQRFAWVFKEFSDEKHAEFSEKISELFMNTFIEQ